jgi:hypothetical protein
MAQNAYPMLNPTGVTGAGNFNGASFNTSSGFSVPGTGGAGNMGYGNSANPYSSLNPGGGTGNVTVTSEGATTSSGNPYGLAQSQAKWMEKYLQETYGGGMGALIYQYLMSNGGYNSALTQQSTDAQINAMGQQTQLGANNLASELGAAGVAGSSSGYTGAMTNYENEATKQQNAITAQEYYNMWNESQNREANMMQFAAGGTAKTLANKSNWMDYVNEFAGLGMDAVSAYTSLEG